MNNILCTICARGGSKGLKNKNIKKINSKPLIAYSIQQAINSRIFKHVVVSTDSDEIANIAKSYGAEVFFKREKNLSNDKSGKLEVIKDAFKKSEKFFNIKFDYLVDLDATSPLRLVSDITESFELFLKKNYNNLFSVCIARKNPYFNLVEIDKNNKINLSKKHSKKYLTRQSSPLCYDMNASIYIWKRNTILNSNSLFLENTGIYVMPEERSIDIDNDFHFKIVEFLLSNEQYAK